MERSPGVGRAGAVAEEPLTAGAVDLSDLVGKEGFGGWQDEHEFRKVHINGETGTVAWPGGIDLAPDALHRTITGVGT
jgi:hypothetical protein